MGATASDGLPAKSDCGLQGALLFQSTSMNTHLGPQLPPRVVHGFDLAGGKPNNYACHIQDFPRHQGFLTLSKDSAPSSKIIYFI